MTRLKQLLLVLKIGIIQQMILQMVISILLL
nr:MAG TPA: hypothetical protein [Caudoviricetes sp.]